MASQIPLPDPCPHPSVAQTLHPFAHTLWGTSTQDDDIIPDESRSLLAGHPPPDLVHRHSSHTFTTMAPSRAQIGRGLAKVLGIQVDYRNETGVTRGESVFSVQTSDSFVEDEPTSAEWLRSVTPSGRDVLRYFYNLFHCKLESCPHW